MKLFYTDIFVLPLPDGHRFPMEKYARLRECLRTSGEFAESDFQTPAAASDEQLCRAHDADYVARVSAGELSAAEVRRIGFPWSLEMVERSRRSAGATIAACRVALDDGCAVNLAGGTHHAHAGHGEGFCVFNDAAVAARVLQAEGLVQRVAVVDCDVHQGNGTASICAGDASIFTFSMHGARNFPYQRGRSDLSCQIIPTPLVGLPRKTKLPFSAWLPSLQQWHAQQFEHVLVPLHLLAVAFSHNRQTALAPAA